MCQSKIGVSLWFLLWVSLLWYFMGWKVSISCINQCLQFNSSLLFLIHFLSVYEWSLCKYNFERTTQSTSRDRCQSSNPNAQLCDFHYTWSSEPCFTSNLSWYMQDEFYWTNKDCALKAKGEYFLYWLMSSIQRIYTVPDSFLVVVWVQSMNKDILQLFIYHHCKQIIRIMKLFRIPLI